MTIRSWDIFCTVIDNFGDIGVCWRLARQLAQEHGHAVRLWVDDLGSFARLAPALDPAAGRQRLAGVEVRRWIAGSDAGLDEPGEAVVPHDAVIEAFACELPPAFVARMAQAARKPAWINLEYLSAEPWVREHHGMASPHPRLPLVKYFFFPGFEPGTGGVLRESLLGMHRRSFTGSPAAQARLWHRLGVTPIDGARRVSLFAYPNPALPALLAHWRDGDEPVQCLMPAGPAAQQAFAWAGPDATGAAPETARTLGRLHLHRVPFLPQEQFDELLWACDINFVRGEDSFVRAQWAARPFVWHIYPQADDAHRVKLDAFLTLYRQQIGEPADAAAITRFWHAWNGAAPPADVAAAWDGLRAALPGLARTAQRWQHSLAALGDLAANLVAFCESRVK
ncbi:elongation factor P maturation arginine rhamnosyltransferase EarP [Cupriavidus gilardii]|uniref:elongation factor P maturation arginine rhamnosyltransferase EarP n=1 Tax=Cupriavidus gilardii TaxID=82541 RepID=UPI0021BE91A4|nr:elongation factor P maturation arginine rhamnosyltransferase EarP [Cupriavidus gilardii]MCT9123481.1 elongation factor P maturation arginine rhamnosyltransferase EarP [Cupriavidus gilardii]